MKLAPLIFVLGDKGGVGKSTIALGILHFISQGRCVDGDIFIPDLVRVYGQPAYQFDLRQASGWQQMLTTLSQHLLPTVVSTPSGNAEFFKIEFKQYEAKFRQLGYQPILVWVMHHERDSCHPLTAFSSDLAAQFLVVLNGFWGPPSAFKLWQNSKLRLALLQENSAEIYWPSLNHLVASKLSHRAFTYAEGLDSNQFMLGDKANLQHYLEQVYAACRPTCLGEYLVNLE